MTTPKQSLPPLDSPLAHAPVTRMQWGAFALAAVLLVAVLHLHLLLGLLCALATYSIHQVLVIALQRYFAPRVAEVIALLVVLFTTAVFVWFVYIGLFELHEAWGTGKLTHLLESILLTVHGFDAYLPNWILEKMPQDAQQAQALLLAWSDDNPDKLKIWGTTTARALAHIIIGVVIGFLAGSTPLAGVGSGTAFSQAWRGRMQQLYEAFKDVVSAQLRISIVNTVLTGIYLLVLLPLFGYKIPLAMALIVLTFLAGLLPIVGNLVSNTAITLVSLTISPWLAITSLAFLVGVHKLEYFINAKIMGDKLRVRTYELLAIMLIMESGFGIAGLVAAPVYYAWLTRELRSYRVF